MKIRKINIIAGVAALSLLTFGTVAYASNSPYYSWSYVNVGNFGKTYDNMYSSNWKKVNQNRTTSVTAASGLPSMTMYEALIDSQHNFRSDYQPLSYNGSTTAEYSSVQTGNPYFSRVKTNNMEWNSQTVGYNFTAN